MNLISEKLYPKLGHEGDPGRVATQLFSDYNLEDLEVLDFDGAESSMSINSACASSQIRFYVEPEDGENSSVPFLFQVEFFAGGARAHVYSL